MASARKPFSVNHPVVITFLIFAIIGFMYLAAEVLKPLALAVLLAFALAPLCSFLEKRGLPRFLSAVLTVVITLGVLGFVGYKVGGQLSGLAKDLPKLEKNLLAKLDKFKLGGGGTLDEASKVIRDVSEKVAPGPAQPSPDEIQAVRVVNQARPNILGEVAQTLGPILEAIGILAFDLILVLFILNNRDDLADRIIRLFGRGRISLTTKTMEEVGGRISRYLMMFATVNSCVGVVVGLGLWAIGLPYPLLWGVLAALLRFIPYAGPATAFGLPLIFSMTQPGEWVPLEVIALFGTLEVVANSFLEPMIYGRTTGVSALGLLVAAMFWTWLWGALGLLLSTPLTVCLAVMGKYVPALKVFATFLGEEASLKPDVRFYQRLLARDQDGAASVSEEILAEYPPEALFDGIFIPTLSMAERDSARDDIDEDQRDFAWWVIDEIIQDMEAAPPKPGVEPTAAAAAAPIPEQAKVECSRIVGVPTSDRGDLLPLRMLQSLLSPSGCRIELADVARTPLEVVEKLAAADPTLILISYLPPGGLVQARYLVRRIRARFPSIPIVVGRWAESSENESADRLQSAGATAVVATLAEARDRIFSHAGMSTSAPSGSRSPEPVGV